MCEIVVVFSFSSSLACSLAGSRGRTLSLLHTHSLSHTQLSTHTSTLHPLGFTHINTQPTHINQSPACTNHPHPLTPCDNLQLFRCRRTRWRHPSRSNRFTTLQSDVCYCRRGGGERRSSRNIQDMQQAVAREREKRKREKRGWEQARRGKQRSDE